MMILFQMMTCRVQHQTNSKLFDLWFLICDMPVKMKEYPFTKMYLANICHWIQAEMFETSKKNINAWLTIMALANYSHQ